MSHTKTLVSWILAAKRRLERYLFHPWKTSQTLRSKQDGQTFLIFLVTDRRRIKRKYLWLQEEQTLSISATVYVCVLCVYGGGVIAEGRKSKGRENNTDYSLHPLPWWFSETSFSAEVHCLLILFSSSSGSSLLSLYFLVFHICCMYHVSWVFCFVTVSVIPLSFSPSGESWTWLRLLRGL